MSRRRNVLLVLGLVALAVGPVFAVAAFFNSRAEQRTAERELDARVERIEAELRELRKRESPSPSSPQGRLVTDPLLGFYDLNHPPKNDNPSNPATKP
jgi:hypothetical protein